MLICLVWEKWSKVVGIWVRDEDVVKGSWIMERIEWFEEEEFFIASCGKSNALIWDFVVKWVENWGVRPM